MNFFIHSLNKFVFWYDAGFLQSGALYVNIRHDPGSEYNQQKSEPSKLQGSWEVLGDGAP